MVTVVFRAASLDDANVVSGISRRAYVPAYQKTIGAVPKPAWEDYSSRIASGLVWLAEVKAVPAGVLVVERNPDFLLVYSIAVDPPHQGNGLGAALLKHAEEIAARGGLSELRLYTNSRMAKNLSIYRKAGFREFGQRPHPSRPGELLVDMSKAVGEANGG